MEKIILNFNYWIDILYKKKLLKLIFWSKIDDFIKKFWKETHISTNTYTKLYDKIYYFCNNSLQICVNNNIIYWIEISYDIWCKVMFLDKSIFNTKVDDLISYINKYYKYDKKDPWLWNSFIFHDIGLSLRRENKPQDFKKDLWENEYQKWVYFNTVRLWKST